MRNQFPLLNQTVNGRPLIYFDNAATTQKPRSVIEALAGYYETCNANIHRGAHYLAHIATEKYEAVRAQVAQHINAPAAEEIIFTSGTTDSINLVAQSYGRHLLKPGDEILLTTMEHHSNIVPWQLIAEERGAVVKELPIGPDGTWQLDTLDQLLSERTRVVAVNHVSNALGTINPVKALCRKAHDAGAVVLVDGAQAVPHLDVDVRELECDFYAMSAHKAYGPMGCGVLWGRAALLERMPPWRGGGEMIKTVSFSKSTYNDIPFKFEAGTPNVEGVIGLGAALEFIQSMGSALIKQWEHQLLEEGTHRLSEIDELTIYGPAPSGKVPVISFNVTGLHPSDLGTLLDKQGIAVRTGHHCTQPLMQHLGVPGTVRVSFALYNTTQEVETFVAALHKAIRMLK